MKELETPRKPESIETTVPIPTTVPIKPAMELFQKRWFCVNLYPSGKTFKQDAESPTPFLEIISSSLITWVDYITDDPLKDLPIGGATAF
jgi:hypothetical protein